MNPANRPISPHIQIYRPQMTSVLSILHRITGVALAAGAIVITLLLGFLAYNRPLFDASFVLLASVWGRLLLFLWTVALFYHLCNGIRHLFWDVGLGLEISQVYRSGWSVIVGTFFLTFVVWTIGYTACG